MLIELIDSETRLFSIDGIALRSYKYDSKVKCGKGTRLGYFNGYKLQCIATVTDIIISLLVDLTTANIYDNQLSGLLYEAKIYNTFLVLADVVYDSYEWFEIAADLKFNIFN